MGGWVINGVSTNGEARVRAQFPIAAGEVFDKIKYEDFLTGLQNHSKDIFGELPIIMEVWALLEAGCGSGVGGCVAGF